MTLKSQSRSRSIRSTRGQAIEIEPQTATTTTIAECLEPQQLVPCEHRIPAPIHALPCEIITKIFLFCTCETRIDDLGRVTTPTYAVPTPPPQSWRSNHATPLVLSQVCQTWRTVAIEQPRLWCNLGNIDFQWGSTAKRTSEDVNRMIKRLEMYLKRSGSHPVSFSFMCSSTGLFARRFEQLPGYDEQCETSRVLRILIDACYRWEDVFLQLSEGHFAHLEAIKNNLPLLRRLRLSIPTTGVDSDGPFDYFSDAPQLEDVQWSAEPHWSPADGGGIIEPTIVFPWSQLIRYQEGVLRLNVASSGLQASDLNGFSTYSNLDNLRKRLRAMDPSCLTSLSLDLSVNRWAVSVPIVKLLGDLILPYLTSLSVVLKTELNSSWNLMDTTLFIHRSKSYLTLTSLRLIHISHESNLADSEEAITCIVRLCVALRHLVIDFLPVDTLQFLCLGPEPICPQLESLTLELGEQYSNSPNQLVTDRVSMANMAKARDLMHRLGLVSQLAVLIRTGVTTSKKSFFESSKTKLTRLVYRDQHEWFTALSGYGSRDEERAEDYERFLGWAIAISNHCESKSYTGLFALYYVLEEIESSGDDSLNIRLLYVRLLH